MEEYISKEKVKGFVRSGISTDTEADKEYVCAFIDSIPPADVRPIIHGHWKLVNPLQSNDGGAYCCSVCGTGDWHINPRYWKGCPWCLAIMDGEPKGLTAKVVIVGKPSLLTHIPIGEKGTE